MNNNENSLPGIDVLNTGHGDFELTFDPNKPDEVEKAKQTITDMLKRGYAIFVRQGKETFRVRKFDVDKNVYFYFGRFRLSIFAGAVLILRGTAGAKKRTDLANRKGRQRAARKKMNAAALSPRPGASPILAR